jgi:uncharacterized RDD family membrane protein YckC
MGGGAAIIIWILILFCIVAVPVIITSRSRRRRQEQQDAAAVVALLPPHPPMVIATFGPSTSWLGKTITLDGQEFILEDIGMLTAQTVLEYDRQGHLVWSREGMREWVGQVAAAVPAAATSLKGEGVGIRFVAQIIDGFVFVAAGVALLLLLRGSSGEGVPAASAPVLFCLWFGYFWWCEAAYGGTLGKLALGLRVVMHNGSQLTVGAAFLRTLSRLVDELPFAYVVGAIFVWSTGRNQRIGDLAARSLVVHKSDLRRLAASPPSKATATDAA